MEGVLDDKPCTANMIIPIILVPVIAGVIIILAVRREKKVLQ